MTPDNNNAELPVYSDNDIAELIDGSLRSMDKNDDGLVDFIEYRLAANAS